MNDLIGLVTGASSGIGREAALALKAMGVKVYAGARRAMPDLERHSISTISLDVTNDESMQGCVAKVLTDAGSIDILVNCAGYGSYGSIEQVPLSEARHQFEVNVFGAMRMTQLVLPHMIEQHAGRIVNVSSMGGLFSMAMGGWYHATKYAIEALSDSLRQEVRRFGIGVVLIEPGLIHTEWAQGAIANLESTSGLGRYSNLAKNFAAGLKFANRSMATDPAVIGRLIAHSATTLRPRTRYRKGMGAIGLTTLTGLLPDRMLDAGILFFLNHAKYLLDLLTTSDDD